MAQRLHDWMFDGRTAPDGEVVDELYGSTGAILVGKRMFDVGVDPWGDPPPFGMRVFVITRSTSFPSCSATGSGASRTWAPSSSSSSGPE
jgi:hypothetical protein